MKTLVAVVLFVSLTTLGCAADSGAEQAPAPPADSDGLAKAIFAGGCFWCMEQPFDVIDGVISTTSGYTAGEVDNPTYRQVSSGGTGHTEAVEVVYDPAKVSYEDLLYVFWRNIDPLAVDRQFCDGGDQYRTGVYALDDEQLKSAQESKDALARSQRFDRPIATEIEPAERFYPAEEYHQDYYKKNPVRYKDVSHRLRA